MAAEQPLFSSELISSAVQQTLPEGYVCRPLRRSDFRNGHIEVLRDLAYIGDVTEDQWVERFDWMRACNGTYFIAVIVDENREPGKQIVGTGTLIVEKKFLFRLGVQGHIEDIAIVADQQGKKLGVKLLAFLSHIAKEVGCYKSILDCSAKNEGFYVKCGFQKAGSEMHQYYDSDAQKYHV